MSRRSFGVGLLMAAVLTLGTPAPGPALAQKKNPDPARKADPLDSGKLNPGEYAGTLKSTPGSDRAFVVDVDLESLAPVKAAGQPANAVRNPPPPRAPNLTRVNQSQQRIVQAQQRIMQAQNRGASARNPQDARRAQGDLLKAEGDLLKARGDYQQAVVQVLVQANAQTNTALLAGLRKYGAGLPKGYRIVKSQVPVEFQATETVKVRTAVLPEEFDDKGNPKKHTKAELAELRGKDKNLPGYESSLDRLEVGQKVRVTLLPRKKPAGKPAAKDGAVEEDVKAVDPGKKMQVRLIVILAEKTEPSESTPGKGKK